MNRFISETKSLLFTLQRKYVCNFPPSVEPFLSNSIQLHKIWHSNEELPVGRQAMLLWY